MLPVVVLTAALGGCQVPGYGAPHGATTQGQDTYRLWQAMATTALVVGAIVWALIFFVIVRYRRRRRDPSQLPSQRQYVHWVEILFTGIPVVIVAVLFAVTVATQQRVNRVSAHPDVRIEVTGFQWGWRFNYVDDGVAVVSQGNAPPVMVLPVHQTVGITLVSTDVVHSFYVPGFLFQRNAQPGITNHFDINVTKPGVWGGSCTTFCGIRHAQMLFSVRAVSAGEFRAWIASHPHNPTS